MGQILTVCQAKRVSEVGLQVGDYSTSMATSQSYQMLVMKNTT